MPRSSRPFTAPISYLPPDTYFNASLDMTATQGALVASRLCTRHAVALQDVLECACKPDKQQRYVRVYVCT